MLEDKLPWERNPSEIEIIDCYEAEIVGEEKDVFLIEFYGPNMEIFETNLPKKDFEGWPESIDIRKRNFFGLFKYYRKYICGGKEHREVSIGPMPHEKYWNPELLK